MSEIQKPPKRLLTVNEVAAWLNVSASLIYQLVEGRKIPVCRIGNGRGAIRFRSIDIEAYIASSVEQFQAIKAPKPVRRNLKHVSVRRDAS
jgi:excisionase family DNA binding protein